MSTGRKTKRSKTVAMTNATVSEDLRRYHRSRVLDLIFLKHLISRTDIATETGLTGAAISRITRELLDAGLLRERHSPEQHLGRGRPSVELELSADGAFVLGVGIGAYEQSIQIANLRGECVSRRAMHLLVSKSPEHALELVARQARSMIGEAKIPLRRMVGMVVAIAGMVDQTRGLVLHSPNLGWNDVPVAERLCKALGTPVYVEALHHSLNLAEARFGATCGLTDTVLVNAAMGIGASVMEDTRIVRGSHLAAGQIGHMRVAGATDLCTCGQRGCLDTVASGYAVLRRLGSVSARHIPKEHDAADARRLLEAIELERQGNDKARLAFRTSGEHLGDALNAIRAVLDPERIVLAGPLAQTGSYVEGIRSRIDGGDAGSPSLCLATQTNDAAAARLALLQFVFSPSLDLTRIRR